MILERYTFKYSKLNHKQKIYWFDYLIFEIILFFVEIDDGLPSYEEAIQYSQPVRKSVPATASQRITNT